MALADELQKLQTVCPPTTSRCPRNDSIRVRQPLEEVFNDFDATPLASASIGQVHRAKLPSGADVVVKVQHAGISRRMEVDLDILAGLAQLAERIPELVPYRPVATVAEFRRVVRRELDFAREARNMQQFTRNFRRNPLCPHPAILSRALHARACSRWNGSMACDSPIRALTLALASVDLGQVARHGADMYLEMIFHHGFYHADPHPGNLVVLHDGSIGLLDFGMVGRLDDSLREDVENVLMAIVTQDAQQLTSLVMRLGAVPPGLDEAALSVDLTEFVVHYANQPANSFDLAGALAEMIEIVQRYHIALPTTLAMLIKVLIMLDGTGRLLEPHFSLMELVEPYQKTMLRRRLSPCGK